MPRLHELDPVTGIRIRASRTTQLRYEHESPGDLIHVDVKKLGRIPDGGGWRIDGPGAVNHDRHRDRIRDLGFDYVHVAVDDHSRLAFAADPAGREGHHVRCVSHRGGHVLRPARRRRFAA